MPNHNYKSIGYIPLSHPLHLPQPGEISGWYNIDLYTDSKDTPILRFDLGYSPICASWGQKEFLFKVYLVNALKIQNLVDDPIYENESLLKPIYKTELVDGIPTKIIDKGRLITTCYAVIGHENITTAIKALADSKKMEKEIEALRAAWDICQKDTTRKAPILLSKFIMQSDSPLSSRVNSTQKPLDSKEKSTDTLRKALK